MAIYILPFEKMHGLGNDFILIHEKHLPQNINEQNLAKILCNRHYSIGADGLIIVKNSLTNSSEADFVWSYINSDGSYGQMCGNGMRCFAKYVFDRGLTNKSEFTVETLAGIMQPSIQPDGQIKVNMGNPKLKPSFVWQVSAIPPQFLPQLHLSLKLPFLLSKVHEFQVFGSDLCHLLKRICSRRIF